MLLGHGSGGAEALPTIYGDELASLARHYRSFRSLAPPILVAPNISYERPEDNIAGGCRTVIRRGRSPALGFVAGALSFSASDGGVAFCLQRGSARLRALDVVLRL